MINVLVPAGHDESIQDYLSLWGRELAARLRAVAYEDLLRRREIEPGTYVFAALDMLPAAWLRRVRDLHDLLAGQEEFVCLNDPGRTLQRYDLLDELWRRGLNDFRAVRAIDDPAGLRFPVFLRSERDHDGALTPLLHSSTELEGGLAWAVMHGLRLCELLVVEFCDTADAGGHYRKYAAFVVGDRVLARSLACSRDWMLKSYTSDYTRELALEEQAYVVENPHASQLAEIFRIAHTRYGRIDYAVKDGRVQTWEINLIPTIGRGRLRPSSGRVPAELASIRTHTKEHFYRAFAAAFEAADSVAITATAVPIGWKEPAREPVPDALVARPGPARLVLRRVKKMLKPMKPLLKPLVERAHSAVQGVIIRTLAPVGRRARVTAAGVSARSGSRSPRR